MQYNHYDECCQANLYEDYEQIMRSYDLGSSSFYCDLVAMMNDDTDQA
jgi:hypothetical protein